MSKHIAILCLWILAPCVAPGQSSGVQPATATTWQFEAASIKLCDVNGSHREGGRYDAALVEYWCVPARELIQAAYRVQEYQVSGPGWLDTERFNVTAKLPEHSSKRFPEMLQSLLADRFGLKIHHKSKDYPVYALVVGKGGPKLIAPADSGPDGPAVMKPGANGGRHMDLSGQNMASLATVLLRYVDLPVVDMTGIEGVYDFSLDFTLDEAAKRRVANGRAGAAGAADAATSEQGTSIFQSLQKYGLELKQRKVPMVNIVVDHMERTPTEN